MPSKMRRNDIVIKQLKLSPEEMKRAFKRADEGVKKIAPRVDRVVPSDKERIAELEEEIAKKDEALRFYADGDNYDEEGVPGNLVSGVPYLYRFGDDGNDNNDDFEPDSGHIARQALSCGAQIAKYDPQTDLSVTDEPQGGSDGKH